MPLLPDGLEGLPEGDLGAVLGLCFFSALVLPLAAPLVAPLERRTGSDPEFLANFPVGV